MNVKTERSRRHAADFLRLRHLRLLDLVREGGSLAAAARALHLSQPAVTKMLQELEATLGAPLVTRGARGGCLTAAGEAAHERLRLARVHVDAALQGPDDGVAPALPLLRVGLLPLVTLSLLPGAMRRLTAAGHRLRLQVREFTVGRPNDALFAGEVDCLIGRAVPSADGHADDDARIERLPLTAHRLVIAGAPAHPLARTRRLSLERLQTQDWILAPTGHETRRMFDALFLDQGLTPPRPLVESTSFQTNMHLLDAMRCLTVAPLSAVTLHERMGLACVLKGAPLLPTGMLTLTYLRDTGSLPVLQAFSAALAAQAIG